LLKKEPSRQQDENTSRQKVTLYSEWCKRCGNCVAFCPRGALEKDEWGYPRLARPERCTSCKLCEMLCPDFALSVSDAETRSPDPQRRNGRRPSGESLTQSPERLAPEPAEKE
jgi:2-oxoglutarate ferredoxin oxidoreductase subunit delta